MKQLPRPLTRKNREAYHLAPARKDISRSHIHDTAEAAAMQDRFWEMCDSIYLDQGHIDDPHLWERARALELDLERFERERRSQPVAERVRRDFESGIRAGVVGTPAAFVEGRRKDDV